MAHITVLTLYNGTFIYPFSSPPISFQMLANASYSFSLPSVVTKPMFKNSYDIYAHDTSASKSFELIK